MESRRQSAAVAALYAERLAARRSQVDALETRHATIAWLRLALLFIAMVLVVAWGRASAPWLALPGLAFVPLLFVHARVLNARDRARRAVTFYEHGQARLEDRWRGTGERGERFRDPTHLYAEDLDLFGAGGLFELLATARTSAADELLARWLLEPAAPETIRERHAAVRELAPRLDLREDMAVLGPDVQRVVRTEDLLAWASAPPMLSSTWSRYVLPIVAAISVGLALQWILTFQPPPLLVPALVIQGLIALWFRRAVHHVTDGVGQRHEELRVLASLIARIEREEALSPRLRALRADLGATGRSPSVEVRRLARLVELLSSGHNQIFAPISALLLLGTQLAFAAEGWRLRCGSAVPRWLAVVAEWESLCALGTYAAEHPFDVFPVIAEGPARIEAVGIAHPLLPAGAVRNDVALGSDAPHLLLVSGSNMSGKSTLLRTVGLNAVLAQAGAPARADRLEITPLTIGATLRIQDSLQAGRSRFFAEVTRIGEIVRRTESPGDGRSVLFLFDELLAGTNSHDRLLGATGILANLVARGAIGLATTHDLALTAIAAQLGERAVNVHFSDRFENGALEFDYRLKPGVVQTSNALALMRAVGLDV